MDKFSKEALKAIKKNVAYDLNSGVFVRKDNLKPFIHINTDGYVVVAVLGYKYLAHRLAWAFAFNNWPDHEIDHINGIKVDNRLDNLRDVPHRSHVVKRSSVADKPCLRTLRIRDLGILKEKNEEASKYFQLMRYFSNIPSI